jgi:hypothetical protein
MSSLANIASDILHYGSIKRLKEAHANSLQSVRKLSTLEPLKNNKR